VNDVEAAGSARCDSKVLEDNPRTIARRVTEYAAVVDEAKRRTLNPVVVELSNDCWRSSDLA
jgi:hypothetical protein